MSSAEIIKIEFRGRTLTFDCESYEFYQTRNWVIGGNGRVSYLTGGVRVADDYGRSRSIHFHRLFLRPLKGQHVDHINGDSFDNRRSNLRLCTNQENSRNSRKYQCPGATSQYKGVHHASRKVGPNARPWFAGIYIEPRKGPKYLGCYATEIEAARAYDAAAIEHFGEFARLNFPQHEVS